MYLGLDFGTTGARACVIDDTASIIFANRIDYLDASKQPTQNWHKALLSFLERLPLNITSNLQRIAVDATSSTVLLCDNELHPISSVLLYDDARSQDQVEFLKQIAPMEHIACNATSGLSKFLWLTKHTELSRARYFMHQADWLSSLLTGVGGVTDYHNALKSGYDVEKLCWPDWIMNLPNNHLFPDVLEPGRLISVVDPIVAQRFKINPECTVHAGTTDSIAAFLAAEVKHPGEAVTSLGSTLVLKLLSQTRVESAKYGIYSHRYGELWLTGGASNTGGRILRHYFNENQLVELSQKIDVSLDSQLDYYPLLSVGERFPINDPYLEPKLTPRPSDDVKYLHGLLQGLSNIELQGYSKLVKLGATPLRSVSTSGGGARNMAWQNIRSRLLAVPVVTARYTEAAYGAALLAKHAGMIN